MIVATDLARLSWIEFLPPSLGPLKVEALSGDFSIWVRRSLEEGAWPDGYAFVRDLLATHARSEQDAPPLGAEVAASLSVDELDQAAELFMAATGAYFRPKYIAVGEGRRRKIRKRGKGEPYEMAAAEGETGAERLLRVVRAWVQDRADFDAMVKERTGLTSGDLSRQHAQALGIARILEQEKRFAALADPSPGLAAATRALQLPIYKSFAETIGSSTALSESMSLIARSPTVGFIAGINVQRAAMRELVSIGPTGAVRAVGRLGFHPNVGSEFASVLSLVGELSRAKQNFVDALGLAGGVRSLGLSVLIDQASFAVSVNRHFDLRLPAATLAAIGAMHGTSGLAEAIGSRSIFPPGFQMAAALGLEATVARGLVADLLHRYGEEAPDAPVFASALEGAAIIDTAVLTEDEAVSFLQRIAGWLLALIRNEPDVVARGGMVGVLVLVCTLMSGYVGIRSLQVSERSLEVAEQSLRITQAQPTNADLAAVIRESQATRAEFEADRRERAEAGERIRYVHDRTPLRAEPQAQGMVIRSVYPDQLLRVIDEQGEWLKVEVFDYQSDSATRGWISRRRARIHPVP